MQNNRLAQAFGAPPRMRRDGESVPHATWSRRVRDVVARLAAVRPEPLEVVSRQPVRCDGYTREELVFRSARGEWRAALLLPDGQGPHPAVLVCPGRNATLDRVTGAAEPDHRDRNVAEHLARAGFATLTFDYGLGDDVERLAHAFVVAGRSLLGALVEDALVLLAWLENDPRIDRSRIGLFGHSLGGHVALHTALLRDDGLPLCAASCAGTYATMFGRDRTADAAHTLPGIFHHADLPDLFAALAPAPLQIQHGRADGLLDPADAAHAARAVCAGYSAAAAPGRFEWIEAEMGHGTSLPDAVDFFRRALRDPRNDGAAVPAAKIQFDAEARSEILERIDDSLAGGVLTLGPSMARLEALAGAWTQRETIAVNSGTSSLEIALRIIGVEGRTVLVPVNTFFATASAAIHAGGRVDFVDVELEGLGMDPDALRAALDAYDDVAAVVTVHIAGVVSPALRDVMAECAQRGIALVEDAAHALGSTLEGAYAGSFGRFGSFSMYPTKVATSGEGGLLAASAEDLAEARRYRDQGKLSFNANVHDRLGSNWRMSELHASVGIAHLERLDAMLAERRALAAWYDEHLEGLPHLSLYKPPAASDSNYYKYVAYLDDSIDRGALKARLRERHGVALAGEVYDRLLSDQPFFAAAFAGRPFERAHWFTSHHICLPLFPGMTTAQQRRVAEALRSEL